MSYRFPLLALLCLLMLLGTARSDAQGTSYQDSDWNTVFADNCGLPHADSVRQVTVNGDRKLQFTLAEGDKGKCSTDDKVRHRAPYWERAELAQTTKMEIGTRYRISAEVTFEEGFLGEREAFFQIHGWARNCKKSYPPLMLKFNNGLLSVETLQGVSLVSSGRHRNVLKQQVSVRDLYGRAAALIVDFDTRKRPGRLSLSLKGALLVSEVPVDFARCAVPHVKIGVYRPGGKGSGMSRVVFDDLRVEFVD